MSEKANNKSSARSGSIRYRLMVSFVFIALVPVVITGALTTVVGVNNTETRLINQLESVATLKEAEINSWLVSLDRTLTNMITEENQSLLVTVMLKPDVTRDVVYTLLHDRMLDTLTQSMERTGLFEEIFIMDTGGRVVLSTEIGQEGKSFQGQTFFQEGLLRNYVSAPLFSPTLNAYRIIQVVPLKNPAGTTVGILAGRARMNQLDSIMLERAGLGETGETYLVGVNSVLVTSLRNGELYAIVRSQAVSQALEERGQGSLVNYENKSGQPVIGVYHWMDQLNVVLVAEQERAEALSSLQTTLMINVLIITGSLLAAITMALLITRTIANPIRQLALTASQIASGDLDRMVEIQRADEIGALAQAFNSMAVQLRSLFSGLEERVAERTQELEYRSNQLQVASEVARDIASARNLDELLNKAVQIIRARFNFYHAGIFLVDEKGEYAILRAATGEAGRQMLEREHRLKVGAVGLVGFATGAGRPRIAQDVDEDTIHFKNPLLPETRSELALPLRIGTRIIGALDVQSTHPAAFSQEDITVLQTLADQLAVAIENARLLKRMNESVRELESAYGDYTRQSWFSYARSSRQSRGYRYRRIDIESAPSYRPEAQEALRRGETVEISKGNTGPLPDQESSQPSVENKASDRFSALAVPIRLRNQVIGVLNLRFSTPQVPHESRMLAEEISNRLALVLENSRLLQEAQRLALREQQINLISTEVRSSVNLDTILQTTVRELGKALGADRAYIHIGSSGNPENNEWLVNDGLIDKPGAPGSNGNGHGPASQETASRGDE